MIDRTTRLRWRRRFRRSKQQVGGLGVQAEEQLERHFFKRLERFVHVRRFVATWVLLLVLLAAGVLWQLRSLDQYYLQSQPVSGGTYTEGILGSFTNANPLYASNSVDSSVARLMFAGLFKSNERNELVGDLAKSIEVDERAANYTVHLKPNLTWHDGTPLTAEDVLFTYKTIQNPDAKSPLASSYQGIVITAPNASTVNFSLPSSLSSFPYSLTNGIIPKHILAGVPPTQLRSVNFNSVNPVGAGPFKWDGLAVEGNTPEDREQTIVLSAFDKYHAGTPKLNKIILHAFHDENHLIDSFNSQELTAVAGLNTLPKKLDDKTDIKDLNIPLASEVMVFLKTSNPILQDARVRRALSLTTDPVSIAKGLGYPVVVAREPILKGQIGYDKTLTQLTVNLPEAVKLLDEAGWKLGPNNIRAKDNKSFEFRLFSQNNSEYAYATDALRKQWGKLGIDVQVVLQSDSDLQTTLAFHNYDALLYGIAIGADPDVFAYWHSSQADIRAPNRLNFSEYRSVAADNALEGGRTRTDATIRTVKYKPFLEAWRNDVPAIALYQPRYLYLVRGQLYNFDPKTLNSGTDRFANVDNWMVRVQKKQK